MKIPVVATRPRDMKRFWRMLKAEVPDTYKQIPIGQGEIRRAIVPKGEPFQPLTTLLRYGAPLDIALNLSLAAEVRATVVDLGTGLKDVVVLKTSHAADPEVREVHREDSTKFGPSFLR